ncbi:MAG: hypothetical protein NC338_03690 [Firmicutes bacterium]|nr:hypothetical protein [Bacillota bacterium]MCM1401326.1 hypothetical protein [Bacteroides sp.]MCM1477279.1 hypothetical protein [Bacteroides sp.]
MKRLKSHSLLILTEAERPLELQSELPSLVNAFRHVELVSPRPARIHAGILSRPIRQIGLWLMRRKCAKILASGSYSAIISYGGWDIFKMAKELARKADLPVILRQCWTESIDSADTAAAKAVIDFPIGAPACKPVRSHQAKENELSFVCPATDLLAHKLINALAVARPDTHIILMSVGSQPKFSPTAQNITLQEVKTVSEAMTSAIDWLVMLRHDIGVLPRGAATAMAGSVPLVVIDCPATEGLLDDGCAVLFGPNPSKEEFVRGMLPYVESDLRRGHMRARAFATWQKHLSLEATTRRLIEIITEALVAP